MRLDLWGGPDVCDKPSHTEICIHVKKSVSYLHFAFNGFRCSLSHFEPNFHDLDHLLNLKTLASLNNGFPKTFTTNNDTAMSPTAVTNLSFSFHNS